LLPADRVRERRHPAGRRAQPRRNPLAAAAARSPCGPPSPGRQLLLGRCQRWRLYRPCRAAATLSANFDFVIGAGAAGLVPPTSPPPWKARVTLIEAAFAWAAIASNTVRAQQGADQLARSARRMRRADRLWPDGRDPEVCPGRPVLRAGVPQGGGHSPPTDKRRALEGLGVGGAQRPCPPCSTPGPWAVDRGRRQRAAADNPRRSCWPPAPGPNLALDPGIERWGRFTSETPLAENCASASWPPRRGPGAGGRPDRGCELAQGPWPSSAPAFHPACNGGDRLPQAARRRGVLPWCVLPSKGRLALRVLQQRQLQAV